jgi:hypothetical protein
MIKPIVVHIDYVGAISIAETPSATKHARHIEAWYHFICEYITDGVITIIFAGTKDNNAECIKKMLLWKR